MHHNGDADGDYDDDGGDDDGDNDDDDSVYENPDVTYMQTASSCASHVSPAQTSAAHCGICPKGELSPS